LLLGQQNLYEQLIGDAVGCEGSGHWRAGKTSAVFPEADKQYKTEGEEALTGDKASYFSSDYQAFDL
jgi:hypothetical protein